MGLETKSFVDLLERCISRRAFSYGGRSVHRPDPFLAESYIDVLNIIAHHHTHV